MGCFLSTATIPAYARTSLGSTSVLQKSGDKQPVAGSWARYRPYGSYRTTPTQMLTDRDFTGQRENRELGLLYYQARYYLPGVGRFISADTIVPNPANPQSFNRYTYVLGNPLKFIDPSGHRTCSSQQAASGDETCNQNTKPSKKQTAKSSQSNACNDVWCNRGTFPFPQPDIPLPDGFEWVLLDTRGVVTNYYVPRVNDSRYQSPEGHPDEATFRLQGSVILNGVQWSWSDGWHTRDSSSCTSGVVVVTGCLVPLKAGTSPNQNTSSPGASISGAVRPDGPILIHGNTLIYVQTPSYELLVNTRDGCSGCATNNIHVDIFTVDVNMPSGYQNYNWDGSNHRGTGKNQVLIWLAQYIGQ